MDPWVDGVFRHRVQLAIDIGLSHVPCHIARSAVVQTKRGDKGSRGSDSIDLPV